MDSNVVDIVGAALGLCIPSLSSDCHEIMMSLVASRGVFRSADGFARRTGVRNRHQLAYHLRRNGLPPLERLGAWIRIMCWVVEYETSAATICDSSLKEGRDPAYGYRLVTRLTGQSWTRVRQLGLVWVMQRFFEACHPPSARAPSHARADRSA